MRNGRRLARAALLAITLCGCGSAPPNAVTRCEETTVIPSKTDILFVVDDSGSMQAEQDKLATSFNGFINRLVASPVKNDFQIGVTTTSVDWPISDGTATGFTMRTAYDAGPAAGKPYPAGALVAIDPRAATDPTNFAGAILYDASNKFTGTRILSAASPTIVQDFVANVRVGTRGSGKEQGFRAAQLALTDRVADGTNAAFLRSGARLAVIVVSDEDDCSDPASPPAIVYPASGGDRCHSDADQAKLPKVSDYVAALKGSLAGERRDVVVAVIAGVNAQKQPVAPSCNNVNGGYPAYRYKAFVDAFGGAGLIDDVCQSDFSATLASIATLISQQLTLAQEPADPRLLTATVTHSDGSTTACTMAQAGGDTSAADAIYSPPPQTGGSPTVTFQRACALKQGDRIELKILCAG